MSKSAFTDAHQVMVQTLRKARKEAGLDQAVLAAKLGKDQSFVSNIERGQRRVDLIEFIALCRAMGVSAIDIFHEIERDTPDNLVI